MTVAQAGGLLVGVLAVVWVVRLFLTGDPS